MIVGVPKESFPGERRVALVPLVVPNLAKAGMEVVIEQGAGVEAGLSRRRLRGKGREDSCPIAPPSSRKPTSSPRYSATARTTAPARPTSRLLRRNQLLIGFLRPLGSKEIAQEIAATGAIAFAVELMPRTTRAQSMDALSSMATVCGYKAVIIAADTLPKLYPMLTTAAGTITPARVLIIGCGVAGLQAIATAKRLGAVVSAYDRAPRRERAGAEPRRPFRRIAHRSEGCAGRTRLRHRAGRSLLRPPARTARPRRRRKRRGHHRRGRARQESRRCWSPRRWCRACSRVR